MYQVDGLTLLINYTVEVHMDHEDRDFNAEIVEELTCFKEMLRYNVAWRVDLDELIPDGAAPAVAAETINSALFAASDSIPATEFNGFETWVDTWFAASVLAEGAQHYADSGARGVSRLSYLRLIEQARAMRAKLAIWGMD